ncbi:hypothetical protein TNCV_214651 [Trichonephila clavipes]|nr:hypothetical protein TNCV_214651 [Trichonephila clavipes]
MEIFRETVSKDLLPAPGNRSNETHDIERREGAERGEKGRGGVKKRGPKKEDTAGRCINSNTIRKEPTSLHWCQKWDCDGAMLIRS